MKIIKPLTLAEFIEFYRTNVRDERNKIILIYGMHEPLEPTSVIIEAMDLPDNIVAIKHPFKNTSRGVYIEIGKNVEMQLSDEIRKKTFYRHYNCMSESFNRSEYTGKIGDVITKYSLDCRIVTEKYLVSEFDLVKNVNDKKVLTILVHGDTYDHFKYYYGHFNSGRLNPQLFSCKLPEKWNRFARFKIESSIEKRDYLVLEICFPRKGVLRDCDTDISENDKCYLYKGYSLVGHNIKDISGNEQEQYNWTYASQSYDLLILKDVWIRKRTRALNELLIQF